jgi:hypothetical protein
VTIGNAVICFVIPCAFRVTFLKPETSALSWTRQSTRVFPCTPGYARLRQARRFITTCGKTLLVSVSHLLVLFPLFSSPCFVQSSPGDRLLSIGSVNCRGMSFRGVVNLLRSQRRSLSRGPGNRIFVHVRRRKKTNDSHDYVQITTKVRRKSLRIFLVAVCGGTLMGWQRSFPRLSTDTMPVVRRSRPGAGVGNIHFVYPAWFCGRQVEGAPSR